MNDVKINKGAAAFLPLMVAVFNVFILLFPREMTEAAKAGVSLWFNGVLPALAPFIVGANVLMALGAVHFLSVLLNPLMKPLFGVPGSGGFAFAVGLMSGNPVGAKITCELRENGAVTRAEGQRLLSFTSNCGPLFILGTLAAVMLGNVAAGYFIMTVHVISAIFTGLLFKNYKSKEPEQGRQNLASAPRNGQNILAKAFAALIDARKRDNRPIGQILGMSVMKAMQTLLLIGGFIIVFNVIIAALDVMGVFSALAGVFSPFLPLDEGMYEGIFKGVFEMTSGARAISDIGGQRVALVALAGVVSWGGLSIHAQAASYISKVDLSVGVYLLSKLLHTLLAVILAIVLYPVFRPFIERAAPAGAFPNNAIETLTRSSIFFGYTLAIVLALVLIVTIAGFLRTKKRY